MSIFIFQTTSAQQFKPNIVRIGDKIVNYVYPEIFPTGNFIIWLEVDTAKGNSAKDWQCGLDPTISDLIPTNGKGYSAFSTNHFGSPADWCIDSYWFIFYSNW